MTRAMHVVFLISSFAPLIGGGEKQAERQAKELARLGVKVTVLTRQPPQGAPVTEDREGYRVVRFPGRNRWSSTWHMVRWVSKHRRGIDVLHARQSNSPLISAFAAYALTGIPVVCSPMTADPELNWVNQRDAYAVARRYLMRHVNWTAKSDSIETVLRPHFRQVYSLPNGVDTERFVPGKRHLPLQAISVSRLDWPKRVDLLIDAWDDAWGAELLVVGDGPQRAVLERRARERHLTSVRFLGEQADVADRLKHASVYLHASDVEGMPNALMEAMSAGLCCLGSGVGQIPHMLAGGVGEVVANDVPSWRAAIAGVIADAGRRERQGQAARRRMIDQYSLQNVVLQLRHMYIELLRRRD